MADALVHKMKPPDEDSFFGWTWCGLDPYSPGVPIEDSITSGWAEASCPACIFLEGRKEATSG